MKNILKNNETSGIYQIGLNKNREAVISAHFMHDINRNLNLNLYSQQDLHKISVSVSEEIIYNNLVPLLLKASDEFIQERVTAAKIRAKENFKQYGLMSPENVGLSETVVEVMFDRQFLKGSKSNFSRVTLYEQITKLVEAEKPIKMVIPALPYKSSSPLKTRGDSPDLSEINFLLGLVEICKTIDFIYCEYKGNNKRVNAFFTIISDGSRFNVFLNESDEKIKRYQENLNWWIEKLGCSNYIELVDYQHIIMGALPEKLRNEKTLIKKQVHNEYINLMMPIFDPYHMMDTIDKAVALDPDPENCNKEGRFIPLFKSIIYILNYRSLLEYVELHKKDYVKLYVELTRHIFEPYIKLTPSDYNIISKSISHTNMPINLKQEYILEYLRQLMLQEAWYATIDYIAEIRSDRDLPQEPISTCLPDHIRWTIHAKPGQLAILTTTAHGDPVQPWHGVGVFKLSKNNKIKLYTLPILSLEGIGATPVMLKNNKDDSILDQPLFYVHPDLQFENIQHFLERLKIGLTRKRKF